MRGVVRVSAALFVCRLYTGLFTRPDLLVWFSLWWGAVATSTSSCIWQPLETKPARLLAFAPFVCAFRRTPLQCNKALDQCCPRSVFVRFDDPTSSLFAVAWPPFLFFFASQERWSNPLMGWTSTADPVSNVQLNFSTPDQAIKFCKKRGWKYEVRAWRNVEFAR